MIFDGPGGGNSTDRYFGEAEESAASGNELAPVRYELLSASESDVSKGGVPVLLSPLGFVIRAMSLGCDIERVSFLMHELYMTAEVGKVGSR